MLPRPSLHVRRIYEKIIPLVILKILVHEGTIPDALVAFHAWKEITKATSNTLNSQYKIDALENLLLSLIISRRKEMKKLSEPGLTCQCS